MKSLIRKQETEKRRQINMEYLLPTSKCKVQNSDIQNNEINTYIHIRTQKANLIDYKAKKRATTWHHIISEIVQLNLEAETIGNHNYQG